MFGLKKNDTVVILTGRDKGKRGTIIEILPKKGKVMVQGIGMVTRHAKARKQGETSAIKKKESYLTISNVMTICPSCNKPCRISSKEIEGKKQARICHRCKEIF